MRPDNGARCNRGCIMVASPHPTSTEADSEVTAVGVVRDNVGLVPPNYSSLILRLITVYRPFGHSVDTENP